MSWFLGIDTSNYTTSVAAWNSKTGQMIQSKKKLPVKEGQLGLRQSDAVFVHVQQLGDLVQEVVGQLERITAIGVSVRPRDMEGSYMPCFLTGKLVAESMAASLQIPCFRFSHQAGHIGAVLYNTEQPQLLDEPFIAFHLSGGTTESVYVTPGKDNPFAIKIISESTDLYAGQVVDRVGRLLGIPFPAGPELEKRALQSTNEYKVNPFFREGNPSVSGLENLCQSMVNRGESPKDIAKYCFDWLGAMLEKMTVFALEQHPQSPVVYAGGVMSNSLLQRRLKEKFGGFFATPDFSADNAAGIAFLTGQQCINNRGSKE